MQAHRTWWKIASSFTIVLTGVGVVLPGALLPALLTTWRLSDNHAGLLLMAMKGTSTISALLVRHYPRRVASIGIAATAAALLGFAFGSVWALLPLFALYGSGLGSSIAGINIARGSEVAEVECSREMNHLNMLWAAGACVTPVLALHSLRSVHVTTTFATLGIVFALTAVSLMRDAWRIETRATAQRLRQTLTRQTPLLFCLFAALAVGAENCVGVWLTTYVQRIGHAPRVAALTNALFWVGMLLSRGIYGHRHFARLRARSGINAQLFLTSAATGLLMIAQGNGGLLSAALLLGLGLGPLFPELLAIVLPRYRAGIVFVWAGVGAALLPWMIGVISSRTGSLHNGLWVLSSVVALLIVTATATTRLTTLLTPQVKGQAAD